MPRYYFNVADDLGPDLDGIDLPGIEAAKCEAAKLCGAVICDAPRAFWKKAELNIHVTDDAGVVLFHLLVAGFETASIYDSGPARLRA